MEYDSLIQPTRIQCPYCGEQIELQIDASVSEQIYVEDCSVCCRPIEVHVVVRDGGEWEVRVAREDD